MEPNTPDALLAMLIAVDPSGKMRQQMMPVEISHCSIQSEQKRDQLRLDMSVMSATTLQGWPPLCLAV